MLGRSRDSINKVSELQVHTGRAPAVHGAVVCIAFRG
jgi:hypothetical protein